MSWRELLMVGFQDAKFPASITVSNTSSNGLSMTWVSLRMANPHLVSRRNANGSRGRDVLDVNGFDDVPQAAQSLSVCVGIVESVEGTDKSQVVLEQCACSIEVPIPQGFPRDDSTCPHVDLGATR